MDQLITYESRAISIFKKLSYDDLEFLITSFNREKDVPFRKLILNQIKLITNCSDLSSLKTLLQKSETIDLEDLEKILKWQIK